MGTVNKIVNVDKLKEAAVIYDKVLRSLPFLTLRATASELGFNVFPLQGKHSLINKRRHGGFTQSYKPGKDLTAATKLLEYEPSVINPKMTAFKTRDNILSYEDNEMLLIGGKPVDSKVKKHPIEQEIIMAMVKSHGEDIASGLVHAERSDESTSPMGAIDGIFTKADLEIASGAVNAARGNFAVTGQLLPPANDNDYSAYEILVEFIGGANPFLRNPQFGVTHLIIAQDALQNAWNAFRNKTKSFTYATMQLFLESLRADSFCPNLVISSHSCLGLGSRMILQKLGNIDLAINTEAAAQFVQVRNIYEDPNEVQFWLQAGYDTRIRDIHEKVFRTNEQKNSALAMTGDYCDTGGIQINLTGDGGKGEWFEKGQIKKFSSGQYLIGLTPGQHTITFSEVSSKNKPADQTVTVEAGKVTTAEAAYT